MMDNKSFSHFIYRYNHLWGVAFDDAKIAVWHEVLGHLMVNRLIAALDALALTHTADNFPPQIGLIVAKYEEIRSLQAISRRKQITKQMSDNRHYCYICRNDGIVMYWQKGNETFTSFVPGGGCCSYMARCSCAWGKDLNRWSRHQITEGMMWRNPATSEDESLYVPDITDVLLSEDIDIIRAKHMSSSRKYSEKVDVGSLVQGVIRNMIM